MIDAGFMAQYGCRLDVALSDMEQLFSGRHVVYDNAACCFIIDSVPSVYYWIDGTLYKRFR